MNKFTSVCVLVAVAVSLAACNQKGGSDKPRSVADFIHDLDAAKAVLKEAKADPSKSGDQVVINASQAVAQAMSPSMLACWPTKPASTATTDHACLDGKGFKRD
jgi:predicted small lipoprotein YifL